jgi:serine/threonine-protein kinase
MSTDPLIGKQFGSYVLQELLGRGGMAAVYRGYQASIDRSVAVKVLSTELLADPQFSTRFFNEARTLARLNHSAILPLYDFGEAHGALFIVMPLMSNGSLADRLKNGPLSLTETVRIILPIAQGLDFANKGGVLHRDVKPNNILFDQHDNPYLSDFGIAKAKDSSSNLTGTGIIGTPDYMSPEQARGDAMDHRSDLYSLGVVTYQCLTGTQLFRATTPMGVIFKHVSEAPRPLRDLRPDLPASVDNVVLKALAKDPNDRYPSSSDFARALARAAGEAAGEQPPAAVTSLNVAMPTEPHSPSSGTGQPGPTPSTPITPLPGIPAVPSTPVGAGPGAGASYRPTPATIPPVPPSTAAPPKGPSRLLWFVGGGALVLFLICGTCFGLAAIGGMLEGGSATPTAPEATATPEIAVLFEDDFSDPDSGWGTGDDEVSSVDYENGQFVIRMKQGGWRSWGNASGTFSNVRIEVTASKTGAEDASFGIICNYEDEDNYYYAGIGSDGYYGIFRKLDGESVALSDTTNNQWIESDQITQGKASYRVALECADETLTLYADGVEIVSVFDSELTEGEVGLFANTFEEGGPADVFFDDFIVTEK